MNLHEAMPALEAEQMDPKFELGLLASILREELPHENATLLVERRDDELVVAYHDLLVVSWRIIAGQLVCYPERRSHAYIASSAEHARQTTIRLVFEFVRRYRHC
jgi:hypothetical protein